jgi:hypothetical protein
MVRWLVVAGTGDGPPHRVAGKAEFGERATDLFPPLPWVKIMHTRAFAAKRTRDESSGKHVEE